LLGINKPRHELEEDNKIDELSPGTFEEDKKITSAQGLGVLWNKAPP
jgi:hypothetical protein